MTQQDRDQGSFVNDLRAADDLAAAAIRDNEEIAPPPAVEKSARRGRTGWIVAVVCSLVILTQLPALPASFETTPSIRIGATDVDDDTDACIDTLWQVSSVLQYGSFRGEEWVEPITRQPYVVRDDDGHTVVECPNPAAHNLRSLHVSSAHRAPEARE
jgi:hypothetical protein